MEDSNSRRRRGAGIVTPNACTECRKKRSKCDGQTPCYRCVSQNTECVYEVPVRQSKGTMRTEIEQLQAHRRQSERVISALATGSLSDEVVNRIRNGESLESLSEWLSTSRGSSQNITTYSSSEAQDAITGTLKIVENAINTNSSKSPSAQSSLVESRRSSSQGQNWQQGSTSQPGSWRTSQAGEDEGENEDTMNWKPSETVPPSKTTSPSLSCPLVGSWPTRSPGDPQNATVEGARGYGQDHLLGPTFGNDDGKPNDFLNTSDWTSVSSNRDEVEHLMALYFCWEYPTFASLSKEHFLTDFRDRRPRYCSSLLVNAMLALGCRFSSLPESRADPDDPSTSGDHYFAEAKRLLAEDDCRSLTTIQALGLISIREASFGRDTESFYYSGQAVRLATEFGLHIEAKEPRNEEESMEKEVRAATFWGAFALDEAWSLAVGRLPHFSRSSKLVSKPAIIEKIESSEWVPYTDQGAPRVSSASQPSNVRSVFRCFCELAELVHQSLYTIYTPGKNLTSNELLSIYTRFLNWYSSLPAALRLGHNFTPAVLFAHMYYHLSILLLFRPFIKLQFIGSGVSPRDVCSQAADAITALVRSYDKLYTLKRTPSFVPYIVLASSVVHLMTATSSKAVGQVRQGAADLRHMCDCHGFAYRGLDILRFLAQQWNVADALGEENPPSKAQLMKTCGPLSASLNFFCPVIPDLEPSKTLFAPFPMQGRPFLAEDDQIERDGFRKLDHFNPQQ